MLNDHEDAVCEFQWSHIDSSSVTSNLSQSGVGFIVTLSVDCTVRVFNIASQNAECILSLKHENQLLSMALSPDNQLLAVGGHNSDICVWSLKEKKLLKSFLYSSNFQKNTKSTSHQSKDKARVTATHNDEKMHDDDDRYSDMEEAHTSVLDINWSCDGTLISAGINKSIVLLDLSKVLCEDMGIARGTEPGASLTDGQQMYGITGNAINGGVKD